MPVKTSANAKRNSATNPIFVTLTGGPIGGMAVDVDEVDGNPVDVGAGDAGPGTLRVSVSTNDVNLSAIKTSLEIMDNWDDGSDRCKVNIAAQASDLTIIPGTKYTIPYFASGNTIGGGGANIDIDVYANLANSNSLNGYVHNGGSGTLTLQFSLNGSTFVPSTEIKISPNAVFSLEGWSINKLRLNDTGTICAYQVFVCR